MSKELHQAGKDAKKKKRMMWLGGGGGQGMRVMDALRLNTSKSPLQAALSLPGGVSECVRESVQD